MTKKPIPEYTVAEFRANMRTAFNEARDDMIYITRHDETYQLVRVHEYDKILDTTSGVKDASLIEQKSLQEQTEARIEELEYLTGYDSEVDRVVEDRIAELEANLKETSSKMSKPSPAPAISPSDFSRGVLTEIDDTRLDTRGIDYSHNIEVTKKGVIKPKKFADKITTADKLPTTGTKVKQFCEAGHWLGTAGTCMQKGCKYA